MAKGKLNWFQRLSTREIVGEVIETELSARGIARQPVTLYTIAQEGIGYDCALAGHQSSPTLGDKVEVYTEKGRTLVKSVVPCRKENSDGSVETGMTTRRWEPIKKYRILEDKVEE